MTPQVNILGTYFIGTDAYVGIITKVFNKSKIEVTLLLDIQENNIDEYVKYVDDVPVLKTNAKHCDDPMVFTKRRDGKFRERGKDYSLFKIGIIRPRLDPDF